MLQNVNMKKIVRQHNDYVAAPYAVELSTHEIKLIEYMISDSKSLDRQLIKDNQNKQFEFSATELAKVLNTSLSRIVADSDKLAESITKKRIIEKKLDKNGNVEDFVYIPIITFAKYYKGLFTFSFNCYILQFFVDINDNFTEFHLGYLLSMSGAYSIKLYKLLYQYRRIKSRVFSISDLKEQFGISTKYTQYGDFKKYVLLPAINQINKCTDLNVSYCEIKIGRSVNKLCFSFDIKNIKINNKLELHPALNIIDVTPEITLSTEVENFSEEISNQTQSIIAKYKQEKGLDYVEACIDYAKRNSKTNFDKYLSDTLTKGWADLEIKKTKTNKTVKDQKLLNNKKENEKKKEEEAKEHLAKSEIEHLWYKMTDSAKQTYIDYSVFLIKKYGSKLTSFNDLEQRLPLSIFAVTNNKYYDRILESYIEKVINISLNINKYKNIL